jgi:hypothetical protein
LLLGAIEEVDVLSIDMLSAVIEEMMSDQERGSSPAPGPLSIEPEMAAPVQEEGLDAVPAGEVAALLAQRDARTAELEAAISELQAAGSSQPAMPAPIAPDVNAMLNRIERRLEEQEQSFRHVLAMLIEWLEEDASREAA